MRALCQGTITQSSCWEHPQALVLSHTFPLPNWPGDARVAFPCVDGYKYVQHSSGRISSLLTLV